MSQVIQKKPFPYALGIQDAKNLLLESADRKSSIAEIGNLFADIFKDSAGIDSANSLNYSHNAGNQDVEYLPGLGDAFISFTGTRDSAHEIGNAGDGRARRGRQSFMLSASDALKSIKGVMLNIDKNTGTGQLTLRIETDNAGEPSGTLAHANAVATVEAVDILAGYNDVDFVFPTAFTLPDSTLYHIVVKRTVETGNSESYLIAVVTAGGYADGDAEPFQTGDGWYGVTGDYIFKIYETSNTGAKLQSEAVTLSSAITEIIVFADCATSAPTLARVSTDNGATWTDVTENLGEVVTVPSGTQIVLEITFLEDLQFWGFAS